MVTVWRLTGRQYAQDAFSGEGARRYGGRFNRPGTSVVYAAENLPLAVVETLVGLKEYGELRRYVFFRVEIPGEDVIVQPESDLPEDWDARPPTQATRRVGDEWVQSRESVGLRVPSVVVPYSHNYVLNPAHPSFEDVAIEGPTSFPVDPRLEEQGR